MHFRCTWRWALWASIRRTIESSRGQTNDVDDRRDRPENMYLVYIIMLLLNIDRGKLANDDGASGYGLNLKLRPHWWRIFDFCKWSAQLQWILLLNCANIFHMKLAPNRQSITYSTLLHWILSNPVELYSASETQSQNVIHNFLSWSDHGGKPAHLGSLRVQIEEYWLEVLGESCHCLHSRRGGVRLMDKAERRTQTLQHDLRMRLGIFKCTRSELWIDSPVAYDSCDTRETARHLLAKGRYLWN